MTLIKQIPVVSPSVDDSVRAMIARRRQGYSLEADFYLSPAIFDVDMEEIFGRHWIFVAVEPDIPEPGDYLAVDVGRQSVVLVRDDEGQVRAYHNVCRHRGARLCVQPQGSVGNLVCSYHQWTYTLNGKLAYAEHMGEGFDKSGYSLKPVRVESLSGLIFICLDPNAPDDFAVMREQVEPYLRPHQIRDCKVAAQIDIIEDCNWKLTMENNRECYHCAVNHPELTVSLFEFGFGYQPSPANAEQMAHFDRISAERCQEWEAAGLPSAELEALDGCVTGYRTAAAAGPGRGIPDAGRQRRVEETAGRVVAARPGRLVAMDAAQRLVPLDERPHRCLLGVAAGARKDAGAHPLAGPQGRG
jgi:Rieske 2Fe-2S family protein